MRDTMFNCHRRRLRPASRRRRAARPSAGRVDGPEHDDAARRGARPDRAPHGRRRRTRGPVRDRRRPARSSAGCCSAAARSRARGSSPRSTVAKMTSAADARPSSTNRAASAGTSIRRFSSNRGELLSDRIVRPHRLHRHVDLDRSRRPTIFVIFLSNRVHPDGKGDVTPLRGPGRHGRRGGRPRRAGRRSGATDAYGPAATSAHRRHDARAVRRAGADRASTCSRADGSRACAGRRVGLVTNHTGSRATARRTIDLLHAAKDVKLVALFSPEHGIRGIARRQGCLRRRTSDRAPDPLALRRDATADRRDARRASTRSSSTCRTSARASTPTSRRWPT